MCFFYFDFLLFIYAFVFDLVHFVDDDDDDDDGDYY